MRNIYLDWNFVLFLRNVILFDLDYFEPISWIFDFLLRCVFLLLLVEEFEHGCVSQHFARILVRSAPGRFLLCIDLRRSMLIVTGNLCFDPVRNHNGTIFGVLMILRLPRDHS